MGKFSLWFSIHKKFFYWNYSFVTSSVLMKSDTGGLANEAYLSNPIVSWKQLQNYKLNWIAVHIAFQNIVHGSIFREKQTGSISTEKQAAVHITFQNTVHSCFFREKQTAVHIAFQNLIHGSFFLKWKTPQSYVIVN